MRCEVPKSLKTRLLAIGGMNPFGEPMFRIVWGEDRLTWIGGEWATYDDHGNITGHVTEERQVQKYLPAERFYLEKWMPPEHYGSREKWELNQIETVDGIRIQNLGPYPSRGEYELSVRFAEGATLLGNETAIIEFVQAVKWGERRIKENWQSIEERERKKERDWNTHADAVLDDTNIFEGKPHVYQPPIKVLTARELKAIRYLDMGAKVERAPESVTLA